MPRAEGRLLTALRYSKALAVPLIADDLVDKRNHELFRDYGIINLMTARRTADEVESALSYSKTGRILFVSSPDHLPRVVRDVLARGGSKAVFAASSIEFSVPGVAGVKVTEPAL
jgi:hypothetical protein